MWETIIRAASRLICLTRLPPKHTAKATAEAEAEATASATAKDAALSPKNSSQGQYYRSKMLLSSRC